jgi:PAS domain S-box-containing protein
VILDGIPCMAWTYDALGALDYVNARWTEYTGLDLIAAQQAMSWSLILRSSEAESFAKALRRSLDGGVAFRWEIRLKCRDHSEAYRWHVVVIEPTIAGDGKIVSWLGTALDIEDQKRAERAESALDQSVQEYQKERSRSTLFQQALLPPHLPTVAGLSFDAVYEPGMSDDRVGGDWYDAVRLLDGRVLLTIGDVAGSGLKAAVIMGVVRQIMRGIAQLHAEPAMMLDAADRALRLEYPDALVTAWVGILDLVGRRLRYASAGHPPPLLVETNGSIRELDHRTLPIGLRQGHQGHASSIEIPHGSAIWLYTDGLIEASRNIVDGISRLRETALRFSGARLAHPAATIRRQVITGYGAQDDIAILVVTTNFDESERYLTRSYFHSADELAARNARQEFKASLSTDEFSENDAANAEIVFGELCGNVARYAPGRVDIIVDRSGIQTVLHILDRGIGFRHLSRLPADLLAEQGRGLFIVASMTTEFTVSGRAGGGSHVRAVLVGRYPISLFPRLTLPVITDQVTAVF